MRQDGVVGTELKPDALGQALGTCEIDARQQQHKFFSAKARHQIVAAHIALQCGRYQLQHLIVSGWQTKHAHESV